MKRAPTCVCVHMCGHVYLHRYVGTDTKGDLCREKTLWNGEELVPMRSAAGGLQLPPAS